MPLRWDTPDAITTIILGAGVAPTLKALASGGRKLGSEQDGATNLQVFADFELQVRGAVAFTLNKPIELYILPSLDGTNYPDGDDSTAPPQTAYVGAFIVRAVATQQRIHLGGVRVPPFKWKPLLINNGGQAFTNTDNENLLRMRTYALDPNAA